MRKLLLALSFIFVVQFAQAQFGVAYLHSNMISAIGASYEINDRIWSEVRIGVSVQNFTPHIQANYNFFKKEKVKFYAGAAYSYRYGVFTAVESGGMMVTVGTEQVGSFLPGVGFNINPFTEVPNFYFSAESLVVINSYDTHLQGSIGLRYVFAKD